MADTFQFDLVSPERRLSSVKATAVRVPGADGDMTIMAGHAPVITTLRPGLLHVDGAEGQTEYVVTGGFAEITAEAVTVLAERSHPRGEMTQAIYDEMVSEARRTHAAAREAGHGNVVDDSAKLLADMVAMGTHVGLDPKQPNL